MLCGGVFSLYLAILNKLEECFFLRENGKENQNIFKYKEF